MRIVPLVENTTKSELKAKHGLSLYIETKLHKILFDLGSDNTLFENAVKRNIDISKVDTVIISHGHFDHGGALKKFLDVNSSANILYKNLLNFWGTLAENRRSSRKTERTWHHPSDGRKRADLQRGCGGSGKTGWGADSL